MEEENRLFSKLVSLHEVTKILASTHEISDLNRKVLDYTVKISKAGAGALMLMDEADKLCIVVSSTDPFGRGSSKKAYSPLRRNGPWKAGTAGHRDQCAP